MDIIINLNISPSSPEGQRINYLSMCLNQLNNLYSVVDSTNYKDSMNSCIATMANYILNDDIADAILHFDTDITIIQGYKETFFNEYGNWFKNQYNPPV
jgi:hypothetical protein